MFKLTPLKIALIYTLFGVVWITTSDLLMEAITSDPRLITELSLFKGWLFMAITATVLYGLVRRYAAERVASESMVRASEEKYRALIETTGTGFVILDGNGRVLDANEEYARLTGSSAPQEIRGRSVTEWTAEQDRERNAQEVRRCLEQGFVRNLEIDYVHRSGATVPVEINATVIELNGTKQVLSLVRDISERRKTREARSRSEKRFQAIFDNTPLGICVVDMNRRIIDSNPAFRNMLGYTAEEMKTLSIPEISVPEDDQRTRSFYGSMLAGSLNSFSMEKRYLRKDRSMLWANLTGTLIRTEKNDPAYSIGIIEDITERKRSEEALRESEEKYRSVVQNADIGIAVISPEMKILSINPKMREWFPSIHAEGSHLCYQEFNNPPRDSPCSYCPTVMTLRDGEVHEAITETPAGAEIVNYRVKASPIKDRQGRVVAAIELVEDITERRKAEQALQKSETTLNEAQQIAHVGSWEWDLATNRVYWSDELYRIYGYSPGEVEPDYSLIVNAMHPESRKEFLAAIDGALGGEQQFDMDYEFYRKDGTTAVLHSIGTVLRDAGDRPVRMTGIVQDITDRRRSEAALRESEEKFRSIFDTASDGILIADAATKRFIAANRTMCDMLGYARDELLGLGVENIHPSCDLTRVFAAFERQMKGDLRIAPDLPVLRKDGSVFFADVSSTPALIDGKQCAIGIFRDITERKTMEDALRNSRDFIDRILDTVDEAFIVIDRDYRIIMANNAYAAQADMPLKEIIGKHCHEISHHSSLPCYETGEECGVRRCFETGQPHTCVHKHSAKDGSVLYVETKAFPLKDPSGNVTSAIEVINNITDKHLLEEQMLRTQKLEAVGLLAGGIAHDFNNLLQAVFGNISLAKMYSDKDGQAHGMLEDAEAAMYQATHLTKQLLTFSKGGEPVKRTVALPVLVEQAARFALSGSNVRSRISKDPALWTVEADEGQLNQVIHNIVLNACEAMPDGGSIALEMKNVTLEERSGVPLPKGKYVRISIKDSGAGIPEQYLFRIFDPYFTTKQKGSGLGLATSYSIIAKHGGLITVTSQPGAGSTFFVYLPASDREHVPVKAVGAKPLSGHGKILVMDDEEVVRTVAGLMVTSLGYTVELSENGDQAVEQYVSAMRSSTPFDAVILDLTVRGGMGGKETVAMIREIDPAVRAIVSSGYSDDAVVANYREHGFSAVLSKPYQVEELSRALQEIIGGDAVPYQGRPSRTGA